MTKYTRREFFKSIVPVSIGIVSFLGSDKNSLDMLDEYDFSKGVRGKYVSRYAGYSEFPGLDHAINTGKNYSEITPSGTSDLYFLKE